MENILSIPASRISHLASRFSFLVSRLTYSFIFVFLICIGVARGQVAYQFQVPDEVATTFTPKLTMDCLAADGYGQWTSSSSTNGAHLLSNKLTSSIISNAKAGILSSTSFGFVNTTGGGLDVYPTADVMKVTTNLQGNVRYVWINDPTARNVFYYQGFDPGPTGIDIGFSTLPGSTSIVKALTTLGSTFTLASPHKLVSVTHEANPLDRFDIAMDASFLYIVWEEWSSGSPAYTIWANVISLSTGSPVSGWPKEVTPATGNGSTGGRRPTVAVDVRYSGSNPAPFDIVYLDPTIPSTTGNVWWTQWNGTSFNTAISMPTLFPTLQNWEAPLHARIIVASQATITPSINNQRGVYIIAATSCIIGGPPCHEHLFLDRIVNNGPLTSGEYCDGFFNASRPAGCPVESGTPYFFNMIDNPITAFSNPYEGANANSMSLSSNFFTEFHCMYQLSRAGYGILNPNWPLMIIPGSNVTSGFCVSGYNSGFHEDPADNGLGIIEYCGAVNQMGIHTYWISSDTNFNRRDKREFDQDIEENTLMTDECDVGNSTSLVGTSSPTLQSGLIQTLYSDPSSSSSYSGSGNLVFDNNATLNIGSSSISGCHFVIAGIYNFNSGFSPSWTLNFGAGDTWDFYAYNGGSATVLGGTGLINMNATSESTTATLYGAYVTGITNPVTVNIHGGTGLRIGTTSHNTQITATGARFNFINESTIIPGGSGTATGGLALDGSSAFTNCEMWSSDAGTDDPVVINIGANGTFTGCGGSGNANYGASYWTAGNSAVSFTDCYFRAGQSSGITVGHAYLQLSDGNVSPSAITVTGGMFSGWSVKALSSISPWWPISISDAAFDRIQEFGINISEASPSAGLASCMPPVPQNYNIYIGYNDFLTYNLDATTHTTHVDGVEIQVAPDIAGGDPLRESITVENNTFEGTKGAGDLAEADGSIEAAIHFSDVTGDIGYNTIYTPGTPNVGASKYQNGIWNESSTGGSNQDTWSLICSNAMIGLTNTGATGLSTDFYTGYAKLNSSILSNIGHVSGATDAGHVIFSTYSVNSVAGYSGTSSTSMTDMTGVHHNVSGTPNIDDVAAFNYIDSNATEQILLSSGALVFLGKAWSSSGAPTWSVFGENNIEQGTSSSVTLLFSGTSVNIKNVDQNWWGSTSIDPGWNPSTGFWDHSNPTNVVANDVAVDPLTVTGNTAGSQTSISGISCSGGLIADRKGSAPQAITDTFTSYDSSECYKLGAAGWGNTNNQNFLAGYDTLKLYLEHCYQDQTSYEMFDYVNEAVSGWSAGGVARWPDYLSWLKSVLYLRTDTNWYCWDVNDMVTALYNDEAAKESAYQYILQSGKCPLMTNDFQTYYNSASHWRYQHWLDSFMNIIDTNNDGEPIQSYVDSALNADTLAHPYDSTIPSLYAVDLQILMGPQFAGVQQGQAASSQALLSAQLLDNPMASEIDISFEMGRTALVTMQLSDILGRTVPLSYANYQLEQPGQHDASIPAPNLPPGTYYLRITTDVGDAITLKVVKE